MSQSIDKNYSQRVTSVGNAWAVCDSKSRPGFKYYFNTVSGQSVWNLSPEEIEKAKKFTKGLPVSELEKCPEPTMDPPQESNIHMPKAGVSRTFNDSITTRQMPNQLPNMFPMSLMKMNNMSGVPNINGLNPLIWSNPPNIATAPMIYVAYPQIQNFQQQEYSQSIPAPVNEGLRTYEINDNFNRRDREMRGQDRFAQRNINLTNRWNGNGPDLRQKLMRKRSKSFSSESTPLYQQDEEDNNNKNFQREYGVQMNMEETPSKYDLSVLEQLKAPHARAIDWIVVVDTDIILKYFPLLDKITDADQNCYLLVPDHVMKELRRLATFSDAVQVRRIFRFLSQQIDAQLVLKGDEKTNSGEEDTYKMLATCEDLVDEFNVILLSNDVKYQIYKNNDSDIHIFTFDELTQFFNSACINQASLRKSPTLGIKIVVPNDKRRLQTPTKRGLSTTPKNMTTSEEFTSSKLSDNIKKISISNRNIRLLEKPSSKAPMEVLESFGIVEPPKTPNFDDERNEQRNVIKPAESTQPKYRFRKRRISNTKAKSLSITSDSAISTDPFRRDTASVGNLRPTLQIPISQTQVPEQMSSVLPKPVSPSPKPISPAHAPKLTSPMLPKPISPAQVLRLTSPLLPTPISPILTKPISPAHVPQLTSPMFSKPISPIRTPSIGRSSVSSHKDISRANIIIEETSTSGVISNTTIDSDNVVPIQKKVNRTVSVCEIVELEMFSVGGQSTEDVIRTRREEWVLRFVQIMEESLKEMLRADAYQDEFQSKCCDYSPVWAADLPELARCIIKKYNCNFNVVDAANRLSFMMQMIGDTAGTKIEPKQYMEMYSYGVYLIKSLKAVSDDCEDLNTAHESLKKLLYDIQNANLDLGPNDTFADELNKNVVKDPQPTSFERELPKKTDVVNQNTTSTGNLLPPRKEPPQGNEDTQEQLSFMKTNFFSNLALGKKANSEKSSLNLDLENPESRPNTSSKTAQTPPQNPTSPKINSPIITKINDQANDKSKDLLESIDVSDLNTDVNNTSSPVKISFVRNFSSIPQFEEKLSKKGVTDDFDDPIDYEYDDYYDEENEYNQDEDYNDENEEELEDGKIIDNDDTNAKDVLDAPNEDSSDQLAVKAKCEWGIKVFTEGIKRFIERVITLCCKFLEELRSQGPSPDTQNDMKTACASLKTINEAINSLLDSTTPENSIKLLFKQVKLDVCITDKLLLADYRNIISTCGDDVNSYYVKVSKILQIAGINELT